MKENTGKEIFRQIDDFFSKQIELLRTNQNFQKLNELLSTLPELQQNLINQASNLLIILIPLILIITLFFIRSGVNNNLEIKKNILTNINEIKQNKRTFSRLERKLTTSGQILNKGDLVKKINSYASSHGIKKAHISLDNFDISNNGGKINKIKANLKFNTLTSVRFSNLSLDVAQKLKATITKLNVTKDQNSGFLKGNMELFILSKE